MRAALGRGERQHGQERAACRRCPENWARGCAGAPATGHDSTEWFGAAQPPSTRTPLLQRTLSAVSYKVGQVWGSCGFASTAVTDPNIEHATGPER